MIPSAVHLKEGLRIFMASQKRKRSGFRRYEGIAEEVCTQVVEDCWNRKNFYFQTSTSNFAQFWTRDFGICAEALIEFGHKDRVLLTLDYALERFARNRQVTTTITPKGVPYDFPCFASDSLPFIIHSLKAASAGNLLKKYQPFLLNEIQKYAETVIDPETGMVRADRHFSSIKDYARRRSSTYDNCMAAMLSKDLDEINFYNPLHDYDIIGAMKRELWNGEYFYDDMHKHKIAAGDANTFPYWCGLFPGTAGQRMFTSSLAAMKKAGLDRPFPLRYSSERGAHHQFIPSEIFVRDYETHSVWMHLGLCFLDMVKQHDKESFRKYLHQYTTVIERYHNFLEVFTPEGKPFRLPLYLCDEGMLWAAKYLNLIN